MRCSCRGRSVRRWWDRERIERYSGNGSVFVASDPIEVADGPPTEIPEAALGIQGSGPSIHDVRPWQTPSHVTIERTLPPPPEPLHPDPGGTGG